MRVGTFSQHINDPERIAIVFIFGPFAIGHPNRVPFVKQQVFYQIKFGPRCHSMAPRFAVPTISEQVRDVAL
jgi:hypothetical protein